MATAAPTSVASGDTAYLYRAAIGKRSQDYYLRQFARFDGEGKASSSWNWAAYWTTFNWLLYRKMWGWALAYVGALIGLALLVFGVGKLVLNYTDTSAILLSLFLLTLAFVVPGLYANAWFYTHCNEKISATLRQTPDLKQAATVLAADAPDNRRLLLLALGNSALLAVALIVVNGLRSSGADRPQLATREERVQVAGTVAGPADPPSAPANNPASAPATAAGRAAPAAAPPVSSASAPEKPAVTAAASSPVSSPSPAMAAVPAAASAEPTLPGPASTAPTVAVVASTAAPAVTPATPPAARITVVDRAPAAPRSDAAAQARATVTATAAAAPAAAASEPASPLRYVWVIQVGAYAQEDNARRALAQVQGLGLDAGAETFTTAKGPLVRVRVGPFTRQAEAEQAALRIKALDLPVLVIRQRP